MLGFVEHMRNVAVLVCIRHLAAAGHEDYLDATSEFVASNRADKDELSVLDHVGTDFPLVVVGAVLKRLTHSIRRM